MFTKTGRIGNSHVGRFLVRISRWVRLFAIIYLVISSSKPGPTLPPRQRRTEEEIRLEEEYLFGDGDDNVTQDTVGRGTPNLSLHHGAEVEMMSPTPADGSSTPVHVEESIEDTLDDLFGVGAGGRDLEAAETQVQIDPHAVDALNPASPTVEPPPPVIPALRCPFCTGFSTRGPARGLMLHITCRHTGSPFDERGIATLRGLERGICTECSGIRPFSSKNCHRCSCSSPPRAARVGDVVHGTRRQEQVREVVGLDQGTPNVDAFPLPTRVERENILERVSQLSSTTELHIPVALRTRHAAIAAGLLSKIAKDDVDACFLEQLRSKLLLSAVPKSRNRTVELSFRLNL